MTNDELRDVWRSDKLEVSFVSHVTQIDADRLRRFFHGDDHALTENERETVADRLCPDASSRRHNWDTNNAIIDGMGHAIMRYSVAFFMQGKNDALELASGTLVQIGNAILVATAGHVIHETTMLQFVGDNVGAFEVDFSGSKGFCKVRGGSNVRVLSAAKHTTCDVGFFRLDENAPDELGREPLELTRIAPRRPQYGRKAFIYGYPRRFVRVHSCDRGSHDVPIGSISITYTQPVLAPDEWPNTPSGSPSPDEGIDCFVRYSLSDEMTTLKPAGTFRFPPPHDLPKNLPEPDGMSGGGFWQTWDPHNALWNPSSYELVAIQSSWNHKGEYLRGIQARHLLDLVRNECPDLRLLIDEHLAKGSSRPS